MFPSIRRVRSRKIFYAVLALLVLLVGVACTQAPTRGWSGPAVASGLVADQDTLYVGTLGNKVIALRDIYGDRSPTPVWGEKGKDIGGTSGGGLFACGSGISKPMSTYGTPAIAEGKVYIGGYDGKVHSFITDALGHYDYLDIGGSIVGSPIVAYGTIERWSFAAGGGVNSSPAIGADGTIYVGSKDNKLYAVNRDGTLKWSFTTGGVVDSSPAVAADGTIYVGSNDNKLYAINPDGTEKWSFDTGGAVGSSPAIGGDRTIYVGSKDNKLYAVNRDGTEKWSFDTGGAVGSSPAVAADDTIYVGSKDNKLYAVNPDGTEKWSFSTGGAVDSSPAIGADGTIYVGSSDNRLYAVNPDGTEKWSFTTGGAVDSSPAISAGGTIYVGSKDNKLYAVNPDGTVKWSFTTGSAVDSSPVIGADGTIYVGSNDNRLYALNPNGTVKSSFTTGGAVRTSPAIGAGVTIYVGSNDSKLYALNLEGTLFVGNSNSKFYALPLDLSAPKWVFKTKDKIWATPAVYDGVVYIGSSDDRLYALDAETGKEIWSFKSSGAILSTPVIANGTIYIGSCDRKFYAIEVATEAERQAALARAEKEAAPSREAKWVFDKAKNWFWTQALVYDGKVWVGSLDKNVYAISVDDPNVYWVVCRTGGIVQTPPVLMRNLNLILVGSEDGNIWAIDPQVEGNSGRVLYSADDPILAAMYADQENGILFFHAQNGAHYLHALRIEADGKAKKLWDYRTDKK
ncbi:MAG: PQQ-like beta-propeller repeat protein [Chloroflexi bacterium]|nr:PQQ-like beta-propeller repeat protein [Chloroflexota bacterium]